MKIRPQYALELSNERVCLLHRATDDVWVPLIETETDAPNFDAIIKDMCKQAQPFPAMPARVAVMLPSNAVLFTAIPSDDIASAREIIAKQTQIPSDHLVICVADAPCENNVAAVETTTLLEATTYAQTLGFSAVEFTSRWRQFGFGNEPFFKTEQARQNMWHKLKPIAAPVSAAVLAIALWPMGDDVPRATSSTITPKVSAIIPTNPRTFNQPSLVEIRSAFAQESINGVERPTTAPVSQLVQLAALEPSINGTLSPDGFTLFQGKPSVTPPSRSAPSPENIRPKSRPLALTNGQNVTPEAVTTQTEPTADEAPVVSDVAPSLPTNTTPVAIDTSSEDSTATVAQPVIAPPAQETAQSPTPEPVVDLLARANPELAKFRPKMRDHANAEPPEQPIVVQSDSPDSPTDPEQSVVAQPAEKQEPAVDLLALANPELAGARPRARPEDIAQNAPEPSTLDIANPALRGYAPKSRPNQLVAKAAPVQKQPEPVAVEPAQPQLTTAELAQQRARAAQQARQREIRANIAKASRSAIRTSPFPPRKSSNFARTVAKTKKEQIRLASAPATQTRKESVVTRGTPSKVFQKNQLSLVGVFGTPKTRRALFRTPTGRYVTLKNGERVSGWKLSGIGESSVKITKGSRKRTLLITK